MRSAPGSTALASAVPTGAAAGQRGAVDGTLPDLRSPEQSAGFGYLLQTRTPESLARAITHVLEHYPEFAGTSDAMSAHARSAFSIAAMVEKHLRFYERIVARKTVRRSGKTPLDSMIRVAVRQRGQGGPHTRMSPTPDNSPAVTGQT